MAKACLRVALKRRGGRQGVVDEGVEQGVFVLEMEVERAAVDVGAPADIRDGDLCESGFLEQLEERFPYHADRVARAAVEGACAVHRGFLPYAELRCAADADCRRLASFIFSNPYVSEHMAIAVHCGIENQHRYCL